MNTILLSEKQPLAHEDGTGWLIPFRCSDASKARLDEPAYNREPWENELATELTNRIRMAILKVFPDAKTTSVSFRTMRISVHL
jgi:hypothetical protein